MAFVCRINLLLFTPICLGVNGMGVWVGTGLTNSERTSMNESINQFPKLGKLSNLGNFPAILIQKIPGREKFESMRERIEISCQISLVQPSLMLEGTSLSVDHGVE